MCTCYLKFSLNFFAYIFLKFIKTSIFSKKSVDNVIFQFIMNYWKFIITIFVINFKRDLYNTDF